jgi:glycosyltransferase involved in cell wall biosynthesis
MSSFVVVNGIGDSVVAFRGALVRDLVARGHRVIVSTPLPTEVSRESVDAAVRALGAEVEFSPLQRASVNPLREREARAHYRALFERIRPDGVFASNPKPVFHAMSAARNAGVARRVAMITGLGYAFTATTLKARIIRVLALRLYTRALADATTVFFQNQDDRALLQDAGVLDKSRDLRMCAGSGVALDEFIASPLPQGAPVFLMIARLLGDKGVREFAEAARIVRRTHPACRFRLVGWIDRNPSAISPNELDAWMREGILEYEGRVDDVRAELNACSVFVLPSYREGTPKSTLEALATGRPVITTDAPGCRETVIDGQNGLQIPARNAQALAAACVRLADDAALRARMGHASRALAIGRYDVRLVNAMILDSLGA